MRVGYICHWFDEQHVLTQLAALRDAGSEEIFEDRSFSPLSKSAPGLANALAKVSTGDVLILSAMAAFVERPDMLALILRHLRRVGAHLIAIDPAIDTTRDPIAAMEALADIAVSIKAASIAARLPPRPRRGAKGRRPHLRADQIEFAKRERDAGRTTIADLADHFSVPYSTMWRALR